MAHHKSAQERIRRNARRAAVNRDRRSRMRTFLRKVEEAIAGGDPKSAQAALRAAQPELMRSAGSILHKNTASRKMSRLSARIKAMSA
ncbi:MAG: 30S ribosomal protein S20 [Proteobacteria bacterium]|nr:30S ribosomal protein S20 [Pseudomonadota bacterium]